MTLVQEFQCRGQSVPRSEATIEAKFDKKSNKYVIRWEDITQMFPGAMLVLKNNMLVGCECDSDMEELVPRRIAAYPNEVLEVVVADQGPTDGPQSRGEINDTVAIHQNSTQGSAEAFSMANLIHRVDHLDIVKPGQHNQGLDFVTGTSMSPTNTRYMIDTFQHTANSGLQTIVDNQRHQTDRIVDIMAELSAEVVRANALQRESSEKQDRIIKLQEEMKDMQKEMKDMQQQALDRLAIIQGRIQTVITQNYELLEYPIPRLFIILPRESRFRDRFNPFAVPFRLYFLCECGAHTMNDLTSSPHKIHIAKHEGYDIDQPTEFLEKYGSYILAVLQMIKYSTAMATAVVPVLAIADVSEQFKLASDSIKHLKENFKDLVDDAISILQSKMDSTDPTNGNEGHSEFNSIEALEGADLRQLESYLKNKDSARTLGNLYRVVTNEGHVKWVCLDHYRENYKEVARRQLQEVVESNGGDFNENEGKITIELGSQLLARQFYDALQRARGIQYLSIALEWDATRDDLRQLETTVRVCNISILKLRADFFDRPASDVLNRGRRFDPLIDIMTNGVLRSFELESCQNFFKRISRFPQRGNASALQSLSLVGCNFRTTKDAVDLFDGLPRVKYIKIQEMDVCITLSRTEDPPTSTVVRTHENYPPAKGFKSNHLLRNFDDWSKMNIVHFKADPQTISEYGLHRILSRNQQLETLTIGGIFNRRGNPALVKETTRILQQLHHPLKQLTLDSISFSDLIASVGFDHGQIISVTLQQPGYRTIEINNKSISGISVRIDEYLFAWKFNGTQGIYYDYSGILLVLVDAFSNLQVQEIYCDAFGQSDSYAYLHELLALSKDSLTKLTLASSGADWISLLSEVELRNGPFPDLTHFMYDCGIITPKQEAIPAQDDTERLIDWLSGFLPLKSPQQIRQQKMSVELKKLDMGSRSWGRLMNSIDFQWIYEFKMINCTFSEEILSAFETAIADTGVYMRIDGVKNTSSERKETITAHHRHSNLWIKWDS